MDQIKKQFFELLPKNLVSRAVGRLSEVRCPSAMQALVNEIFTRASGLDPEEADRPLGDYESVNDLFTRALEEGARPVASTEPTDVVSPVDGRLSMHGEIRQDTLLQAKGREYTLVDLLDSGRDAAQFEGGAYATLYLAPHNYHRIHSPVAGEITHVSYIPGHLFPVNPFAVENIDQLFAVNERLISYLDTDAFGRVAVIKVGATCVGRITLTYNSQTTNKAYRRRRDIDLDDPVAIGHGDEIGVFNLGSTVILLFENGAVEFTDDLEDGSPVRMGQMLARTAVSRER